MKACVRLFAAYQTECRRQGLLDFDDLLERSVALLEANPERLAGSRRRYPHVLVDEYQDLNLAQERLVELIAQGGRPFVVGNDDQSIYRFRGAARASLERFSKRFAGASTISLGRNHRSSRRIVAAAAALVGNNAERMAKDLGSTRGGPQVEIWRSPDGTGEAAAIAEEARRLGAAGHRYSRIAVLCRTNAIAGPIAEALAALELPHVVIGGQGLLGRPEIRDVMALLRVVNDPQDQVAAYRVSTRVPTMTEALIAELHEGARSMDVRDLFFELMNHTRYLDSATPGATANVSLFAEMIADFCEPRTDHSLAAFMDHLDLVLLSGEFERAAVPESPGDAIVVMTIHQAKGLEFDSVFVPALVEGRLPQSGRPQRFELPQAVLEPLVRGREDMIAEERGLLHVAVERAKSRLYPTYREHYHGRRRLRPAPVPGQGRAAGGFL